MAKYGYRIHIWGDFWKVQWMVFAVIHTPLPPHFLEGFNFYFKAPVEESKATIKKEREENKVEYGTKLLAAAKFDT